MDNLLLAWCMSEGPHTSNIFMEHLNTHTRRYSGFMKTFCNWLDILSEEADSLTHNKPFYEGHQASSPTFSGVYH